VGIRHPDQPDQLAAVLAIGDGAVATSGTYERGHHIVDPWTGRPARGLRSLTVVGPRLGFVDAYATAAFVMGLAGLRWVVTHPGHEALAITDDDRVVWTEGLARYLVSGTGAATVLA
jgi:thiamine biosynthesis lipoprotein